MAPARDDVILERLVLAVAIGTHRAKRKWSIILGFVFAPFFVVNRGHLFRAISKSRLIKLMSTNLDKYQVSINSTNLDLGDFEYSLAKNTADYIFHE